MTVAYILDTTGRQPDLTVLFESMVGRRPPVRAMYRPYQCKRCGKVNPSAISAAGLPPLSLAHIQLDFIQTLDQFYLVSSALADLLSNICGDAVIFDAVGDSGYYLLRCRDRIVPPPNSRAYTPVEPADPGDAFQIRGGRCSRCGRYREVTCTPEAYRFPDEFSLLAFEVEKPLYLGCSICCSPKVACGLEAARLTGLRLIPVPRRSDHSGGGVGGRPGA